jgi:nitrite reductase/ring-hydroxylating ferredoxin subunit
MTGGPARFDRPLSRQDLPVRPSELADRLERAEALDRPAEVLTAAVDAAVPSRRVRDVLHGVWLGHPLHPAMIALPLGSWISAAVLDALPGNATAARRLVGLGVASAVPTALAGAVDWSRLHPAQKRVGVVHAAANAATLGLNVASWRTRRRGRNARGAALSLLGLAIGGAGAYLGGHLSFRQAAGVNHAEDARHDLPDQFTALCRLADLPDGRPTRLLLDATPVFVLRRGEQVTVLAERCSHLSGPLSEGELTTVDGEECIQCPWHGSAFRLADGTVRHGPATAPQPHLETRVDGATVYARFPGAG